MNTADFALCILITVSNNYKAETEFFRHVDCGQEDQTNLFKEARLCNKCKRILYNESKSSVIGLYILIFSLKSIVIGLMIL